MAACAAAPLRCELTARKAIGHVRFLSGCCQPEMKPARMSNHGLTSRDTLPATAGATAVVTAGIVAFLAHDLGPRSLQMALHIAAMSVAAPLAAALVSKRLPAWVGRYRTLWLSTVVQLALLWAWHAPSVQSATAGAHGSHAAAHAALFVSAFVFWGAIIRLPEARRWQAIAALLLTGKLACLLSALLIFSPRALYPGPHGADLYDQQLAGLLMITACPLSYLVAAVVLATQLVNRLAQAPRPTPCRTG
jgi:putative membrane protein